MGCKVRFNAQEQYNAGYQAGLQDYQDKMPVFYGMTRMNGPFADGYDDGYEKGAQLSRDIHEAMERDRIDRIANITDVLCQLGLDAMPGTYGILLYFKPSKANPESTLIHVTLEDAASLATALSTCKAMGVL